MQTIGRHMPRPPCMGDFVVSCDYCGVNYYRRDLRRDGSGLLACDKDFGGDQFTLDQENADGADERGLPRPMQDGGNIDPPITDTPPVVVHPDGVPGF